MSKSQECPACSGANYVQPCKFCGYYDPPTPYFMEPKWERQDRHDLGFNTFLGIPKFEDEIEPDDCPQCKGAGGKSIQSGCFGSETLTCGLCHGKKKLDQKQLDLIEKEKVFVEKCREWQISAYRERDVAIEETVKILRFDSGLGLSRDMGRYKVLSLNDDTVVLKRV